MRIQPEALQVGHAGQSVGRDETHKEVHDAVGDGKAKHAGGCGQHQTFGDELAEQSLASGAERAPYGNFPLAALGAHQQEAGHIDTSDEEEQRGAAEEEQENGTDVTDDDVRQGDDSFTLTAIRVGILLFKLASNRGYVGRGGFDGHAVFQASDAEEPVTTAAIALIMLGGEEVGGCGGSEMEVAGQDADDGVRISIECDGLAENVAAQVVAILPRGITEDDGAGSGMSVFAGRK